MNENFGNQEQSPTNQGKGWETLEQLANKMEPIENPAGASYHFKQEAAEYRALADEAFGRMSDAQKQNLEQAGIRDASDAGEYLHEVASWNRQVERLAGAIEQNIAVDEQRLIDNGYNNGVNPITGEQAPDSPFVPIKDAAAAEQWRVSFQQNQEDSVNMKTREAKAISDLIMNELGQEHPQPEPAEVPTPRSREALDAEAIERWKVNTLGDQEKKQLLENSVLYATIKRKIQKELAEKAKAAHAE